MRRRRLWIIWTALIGIATIVIWKFPTLFFYGDRTVEFLFVLDPPYKGKWEAVEDPQVPCVGGRSYTLRQKNGIIPVPRGFLEEHVDSARIEGWGLVGIQDRSGKVVHGPDYLDHVRLESGHRPGDTKVRHWFVIR